MQSFRRLANFNQKEMTLTFPTLYLTHTEENTFKVLYHYCFQLPSAAASWLSPSTLIF